jgi:hypothetical protein
MTARAEFAQAIAEELANDSRDAVIQTFLEGWLSAVPAEVFKPSGKWMYSVKLDYRRPVAGYIEPGMNARQALHRATSNGTSEVTFNVLPERWFMFVPDPPEGFPVMAIGGAA